MFAIETLKAAAVALAVTAMPEGATASDATEGAWGAPFIGSDPTVLYLPDANATYWRYGWTREPGDPGGIVITGTVPDVRYFSYNVYDDDTKQSLGSVPDHLIALDGGAANPFAGGAPAPGATYTVHVVPEGTALDAPNVLTFPDSIENVSVFLRHYLPEPRDDIHGGAPMPRIERFDPATGALSPPTPGTDIPALSMEEITRYVAPMAKTFIAENEGDLPAALAALREKAREGSMTVQEMVVRQVVAPAFGYNEAGGLLDSYRLDTSGNYPTADNHYLALPVVRQHTGQVLVTRFRASPVATGPKDYPTAPLRYYSLSQGDEATYNYATLYDAEISVAPDGMVYTVIGADSPALREKAAMMGANFMPWAVEDRMLLIYRNMLPRSDYPYGIDKVPFLDKSRPAAPQAARYVIGDYALTGRLMDEADFMAATAMPAL